MSSPPLTNELLGPARRHLTVLPEEPRRVEPPVLGEGALRRADGLFQRLDALVNRFLPENMNPLAQTGAIANTTFIVACVSGVLLLIWYSTSVHHAYESVVAMGEAPLTAGLMRSIHRYSSDACMLFVLLHATKLLCARRFGGARWLAWLTGVFSIGTLWFVGFIGYWLVWDERAQQVALGTARMLDGLPIFADPLSRSFLTDETVNSLLFFVVFFLHMLIPLVIGIALWLHITRLSRPHFLTGKWMTLWVVASLVLVSLVFPADAAGPAKMTMQPAGFSMDYWYLLPIALTDRLSAGALWAIVLGVGALAFSLPWLLVRGRAKTAEVEAAKCNECQRCVADCPYDAIRMVPRPEPEGRPTVALVDPSRCVGCGICAGSCDSSAIGLTWLDTNAERRALEKRLQALGPEPMVAFVCAESASAEELEGYHVVSVPCSGWVHALSVERLLKRGTRGVLIASCGPGDCMYREGPKWTKARMSGEREPVLRREKVDAERVRVVELHRHQRAELARVAAEFREKLGQAPQRSHSRAGRIAAGLALAAALSLVIWGGTRLGYAAPALEQPELVVSFKHPGQNAEKCRAPSEEELKKAPVHMRPKQICERRRADVRLRVLVDGQIRIDRAFEPRGVWNDGNSIAIERLTLGEGEHLVRVEVGDSPDASEYAHQSERRVRFEPGRRRVVLFDKLTGFRWFE